MNALIVGSNKQPLLQHVPYESFLLVDDGQIIDQLKTPVARSLDLSKQTFNPLSGIDHKRARQLASIIYASAPHGENTLTVRNGRRALARLMLEHPTRLDKLPFDRSDAHQEAKGMLDELFLSPVLKKFLCGTGATLSLKGTIVARLNRAELGDDDAFVLGNILMSFYQGHVVVPDFGFYACPFHRSLIRQNRLIAGVNFLDETPDLKNDLLLIETKLARKCTAKDAETLADYCSGFPRGSEGHTTFIQQSIA
jgi:hypothetical protein